MVVYLPGQILPRQSFFWNEIPVYCPRVLNTGLEQDLRLDWSPIPQLDAQAVHDPHVFQLAPSMITIEVQNVFSLIHVTSILQCIGPCNLFRSFRSIFVHNTRIFISCFLSSFFVHLH